MATKPAVNPKSKGGRPPKEINWAQIESLCKIQCTQSEIASVTGFSEDLIGDHCKREFGLSFPEYYKKHSDGGKMSLRRAQFKKAVVDENPTMQIWLGKQMLGQRDQVEMSAAQPILLGYDPKDLVKDKK